MYIIARLLLIAFLSGLLIYSPASEADDRSEPRRVKSLSERVYKHLARSQGHIDAGEYDQALVAIDEIFRKKRRLNRNELGQLHNMRGYVWFLKEDYKSAIDEYTKVVDQGDGIPEGLEITTLYTLAQLSFVESDYDLAVQFMRRWQDATETGHESTEAQIFIAQVYFMSEQYDESKIALDEALTIAQEADTPFKLAWLWMDEFFSMRSVEADLSWETFREEHPHLPLAGVEPEYPEGVGVGQEGYVKLTFIINKNGQISAPEADTELSSDFQLAAAEALMSQTFEPYIWRGNPVDVEVTDNVYFKNLDEATDANE